MENITVRYSTTQRRSVEIAVVIVILAWIFPFSFWKLITCVFPVLIIAHVEMWGLSFNENSGNLRYPRLFHKPVEFHANDITSQQMLLIRSKTGSYKIILQITVKGETIKIILGKPSENGFDSCSETYEHSDELLAFLEKYRPVEELTNETQ